MVSIVSVVFRAAHQLPPLFKSIAANKGEDSEWIVIDGGSIDGTVDILRLFDDSIDYWVSEPDRGIYDAMNKAITAATGEYILHMNAGDRLLRIPREQLLSCVSKKIDLASFDVDMEGFGHHWPRSGMFLPRFANPWHQQGSFYRREGHLGYDLQFPVHSDFDLNQRMVLAGKSIQCFRGITVGFMGAGGVSTTGKHYHEQYRLVRKNFGPIYMCMNFVFLRFLKILPSLNRMRAHLKSLLGSSQSQESE